MSSFPFPLASISDLLDITQVLSPLYVTLHCLYGWAQKIFVIHLWKWKGKLSKKGYDPLRGRWPCFGMLYQRCSRQKGTYTGNIIMKYWYKSFPSEEMISWKTHNAMWVPYMQLRINAIKIFQLCFPPFCLYCSSLPRNPLGVTYPPLIPALLPQTLPRTPLPATHPSVKPHQLTPPLGVRLANVDADHCNPSDSKTDNDVEPEKRIRG